MLNSYLTVLSALIPTAQLNTLFEQSLVRGLAAALVCSAFISTTLKQLPEIYAKKFLVSSSLLHRALRIPLVGLVSLWFLFISPHTSVLANWEERVVAPKYTDTTNLISDNVAVLKIPSFREPISETYISTYFSRWHQGVDLPNPLGSSVKPIAAGEVIFAGWSNLGYGNMVVVRHELGYESLYAHLNAISAPVGEQVDQNSILGNVGATGVASGNHLHLEVHQNGATINPLSLFEITK